MTSLPQSSVSHLGFNTTMASQPFSYPLSAFDDTATPTTFTSNLGSDTTMTGHLFSTPLSAFHDTASPATLTSNSVSDTAMMGQPFSIYSSAFDDTVATTIPNTYASHTTERELWVPLGPSESALNQLVATSEKHNSLISYSGPLTENEGFGAITTRDPSQSASDSTIFGNRRAPNNLTKKRGRGRGPTSGIVKAGTSKRTQRLDSTAILVETTHGTVTDLTCARCWIQHKKVPLPPFKAYKLR